MTPLMLQVCLPQVYELFLKSLVGGLHTVYTKLKRLDIIPRVCNVEQVRALRSLGAIQPGVNRCKLISCKDFDVLYDDCTNTRLARLRARQNNQHFTLYIIVLDRAGRQSEARRNRLKRSGTR